MLGEAWKKVGWSNIIDHKPMSINMMKLKAQKQGHWNLFTNERSKSKYKPVRVSMSSCMWKY